MEKIKGFKGFDKDLKCRGFQYEVGKDYTQEGDITCCDNGFHFCENPFSVFYYYAPSNSRYCKVEGKDNTDRKDDKVAVSHIHIEAELGLNALIKAGVKFIFDKVKWDNAPATNTGNQSAATNTGNQSAATNTGDYSAATNTGYQSAATNTGNQSAATNTGDYSAATNTGDYSAATNTGDYSAATNTGNQSAATNTGNQSAATNTGDYSAATNTGYQSAATNTGNQSAATNTGYQSAATNTGYQSAATNTGDYSAATNTGDYSAAKVEGNDSVAIVTGKSGKAAGSLGCWLVLTERDEDYHIIDIKVAKVDGENIKADTYYTLKNGEITEVKD